MSSLKDITWRKHSNEETDPTRSPVQTQLAEISQPTATELGPTYYAVWVLLKVGSGKKKTGTTRGEFRNSAPLKREKKNNNKLQPPDELSQIQLVRWLMWNNNQFHPIVVESSPHELSHIYRFQ